MSLQPTPQDPLDAFVYPWSYNWTKAYKPSNLGNIGKPLDKLTTEGRKPLIIKLKRDAKPIDVAEQRRNLRTKLLNAKARKLENKLDDILSQNEIEAKYAKQQAELLKLENMFKSGLVSGILNNVSNLARQRIQNEYFKNDPDIRSFDKETQVMENIATSIQENQEQLNTRRQELSRTIQEIGNELRTDITEATTAEQLEEMASLSTEYEQLNNAVQQLQDPDYLDVKPEVSDIVDNLISKVEQSTIEGDVKATIEDILTEIEESISQEEVGKSIQDMVSKLEIESEVSNTIEEMISKVEKSTIEAEVGETLEQVITTVEEENLTVEQLLESLQDLQAQQRRVDRLQEEAEQLAQRIPRISQRIKNPEIISEIEDLLALGNVLVRKIEDIRPLPTGERRTQLSIARIPKEVEEAVKTIKNPQNIKDRKALKEKITKIASFYIDSLKQPRITEFIKRT